MTNACKMATIKMAAIVNKISQNFILNPQKYLNAKTAINR